MSTSGWLTIHPQLKFGSSLRKHKRFFVICGTTLVYYSREPGNGGVRKGELDMATVTEVRVDPASKKLTFFFSLITESATLMMLSAESAELRRVWCMHLCVCADIKKYGETASLADIYAVAFEVAQQAKLHDRKNNYQAAFCDNIKAIELFLFAVRKEKSERNLALVRGNLDDMITRTERLKSLTKMAKSSEASTPRQSAVSSVSGALPKKPSTFPRFTVRSPKIKLTMKRGAADGSGVPKYKCFGCDFSELPSEDLPAYPGPIPKVLIRLCDYVCNHNGLTTEGIFRIASRRDELPSVKQQFDQDQVVCNISSVHIAADLVKIWFRELPEPLLTVLAPTFKIAMANAKADFHTDTIMSHLRTMPQPTFAIYLYLLDLCVDVISREDVNLMGAENMAIVFAPNLFDPTAIATPANPAAMFKVNELVSSFFRVSIEWRAEMRAAEAASEQQRRPNSDEAESVSECRARAASGRPNSDNGVSDVGEDVASLSSRTLPGR